MKKFTQEESKALLTFLARVSLNGNEAETLVYLKKRVTELTESTEEPTEEKKK